MKYFSSAFMAVPKRRDRRRRFIFLVMYAAALVIGTPVAKAQEKYPSRPIRFVVAFAPGGITDVVARLVGEKLSESLGQPIVIDNRGGAAGALGARLVASSPPDGYTFLITTTAVTIGAAASHSAVDPRTQLVPVALVASAPTVLATKAPTSAKTLKELVQSQKDGIVTYASSGAGTVEHLTAAYLLKDIPGVQATHIPFKSGGEALNAVIGGHVLLSTTPVGTTAPFIHDRQVKILGVASHTRMANMPDVPTFAETGLANIDNSSWVSIFGPPGLPDAIADRISADVNQVLRQPDLSERLAKMGFVFHEMSRKEFSDQIKEEVDKWTTILKETGMTLN